jgi:hypothetical protein
VGPVFPRALETYSHSAVGMLFEALKGEWRPCDVAAEALKARSVPTVHHDARVDVDAADFCEGPWTGLLYQAEWADEFGGQTPGGRPEPLHVRRGRAVTGREDWLVSREGVDIAHAFEASAMPLEHSDKAGVGPGCDLRDLLRGGRAELAELQLACFVAHVDATLGQRVEMHVEAEGAVGALHKRERP